MFSETLSIAIWELCMSAIFWTRLALLSRSLSRMSASAAAKLAYLPPRWVIWSLMEAMSAS